MGTMRLEIEQPYPKQIEFFKSTCRYTAYGGARGGGKSWAARTKAVLLCFNYPGIQILLLRRTLKDLRDNHVIPLQKLLRTEEKVKFATYKVQEKEFVFANGSRLVLGYCDNESDVLQYQGQAYDVIFMEEATQFTEFQFQTLTESNRSSGLCKAEFKPRMYFTCNPGGVGHLWFKRLFIDRNYQNKEQPEDYKFIQSLVYENKYLMEHDADYVRVLENLPEDRKKAMLYGDWNVFEGQYFSEFRTDIHVIEPFEIPKHWKRYAAFDYGLDMFACLWFTIDTEGNAYAYKEIHESNLIISEAARLFNSINNDDKIEEIYAPRDLWNRRQETGKSVADIFEEHGIELTRTSVDRVDGWLATKEWLKVIDTKDIETGEPKKTSRLKIFKNCTHLIQYLPQLQADEKNPSDVATEPHYLTHIADALRYFCVNFTYPTEQPKDEQELYKERERERNLREYINYGVE
jgi:phage terminase large subunit